MTQKRSFTITKFRYNYYWLFKLHSTSINTKLNFKLKMSNLEGIYGIILSWRNESLNNKGQSQRLNCSLKMLNKSVCFQTKVNLNVSTI